MQEEYSGAIYIVGPESEYRYEDTLNFLNNKFKQVITIGNGAMPILDENDEGPLRKLEALNQDYPELLRTGKLLVYIDIHGTEIDNQHYIQVNNGEDIILSRKLFEMLAENIKMPMDIIFVPCHGKAALQDIEILPEMSRIIIFSDADKITNVANVHIILNALSDDVFSLDKFYNNYLARLFSMDDNPTMSIVGKATIDPVALSENYFGKTISEASRQYITNHFKEDVCKNENVCSNKIDYLMDKIQQFSSINEFRDIQQNLFEALIEFSDFEVNYAFIRNTRHERDVIYNYKESEYCYIEILELKDKTDQLFLQHKIALELNLSSELWYEINYDYTDEKEASDFEKCSEIGIYNTLSFLGSTENLGFIENDNFAKPEYEEYGLVLGIIKDIHLSLDVHS